MSYLQIKVVSRFLALLTIGVAILVGLLVGGEDGLVAAAIAFAVAGPVVHWLTGAVVSRTARRRGRSPLAGLRLQLAGLAYPILVWLVAAVQVWRTTSVPLAIVMLVLTAVWPTLVVMAVDPTRRAAARSDAVPARRAFAEHAGWRFAPDGKGWLPNRWIFRAPTIVSAYSTCAVLGREIDGYEVVAFDGYATVVDDDDVRMDRTTTWLVLLPVELPETCVTPWLTGPIAPTNTAELRAMAEADPEGALVSSTFLEVAFKMAPWKPLVESAVGVAEEQLMADSKDDELTWSLLTPEVRRATVAGGLAGWRLAGRELYVTRPTADTMRPEHVAAVAGFLVTLARAVQASVADRFTPTPE